MVRISDGFKKILRFILFALSCATVKKRGTSQIEKYIIKVIISDRIVALLPERLKRGCIA